MKRSISIISLFVMTMISLHAMELVELTELSKKSSSNGYGSLADNIFGDINDQQQEQSKSVIIISAPAYLEAVHASLKLDEWYNAFRALSEGAKRTVLRTMSTQLLYLHAIAFCLPPEIVQDHIICALLDGEEDAVKNFYALPFGPAFDVYHDIKSNLADDSLPVGPLYAKSPQVRELILKLQKNPWYYSQPVISLEDNEEMGLLSDDMKNMYLAGKTISVVSNETLNSLRPKQLCLFSSFVCAIGLVSMGVTGGIMSCFMSDKTLIVPTLLKVGAIVLPSTGLIGCGSVLCVGHSDLRNRSQQVTI